MRCCGKGRDAEVEQAWRGARAAGGVPPHAEYEERYVHFQYVGATSLSIRGPFTGRRYDFPQRGAVVAVDRNDATYFSGLGKLKPLGPVAEL